MTKLFKYILAGTFLLSCLQLTAQTNVTVNKDSVWIGEPFTVTIKANEQPLNTDFSQIPGFEFLKLDTVADKAGKISEYQLLLCTFDSGSLKLPVKELFPNSNQNEITIISKGIPKDSALAYSEPMEIINMEPVNQVPYFLIFGIITFVSAIGIYFLVQKLKVKETVKSLTLINDYSNTPTLSNSNLAELLGKLKADWQNNQVSSEHLGNSLMRYLGQYLWNKGYYVYTKTGDEIILYTKNIYDEQSWQKIKETVQLCNYLKFGKYIADKANGLSAIDNVLELVNRQ
ncbi:hypothetical protein [Polluticaenibacter yanchengensis]|uniref:Uncharacterized protein n=1 Tax=Polluticaenibacter yanchengensis TaxID=3014562 RepID=A0ABT4UI98_9BACT|nr:hypothetical protein [Chitinophagaceae bacterium LY-5]